MEFQPSRFPESLNYPQQIYDQISECRKALDYQSYNERVSRLDDLLICYDDDEYDNAIKKIDNDFTIEVKKITLKLKKSDNDNITIEHLKYERSRLVFRELIKLISRSGFLPYREVEGIISEYREEEVKEDDRKTIL